MAKIERGLEAAAAGGGVGDAIFSFFDGVLSVPLGERN